MVDHVMSRHPYVMTCTSCNCLCYLSRALRMDCKGRNMNLVFYRCMHCREAYGNFPVFNQMIGRRAMPPYPNYINDNRNNPNAIPAFAHADDDSDEGCPKEDFHSDGHSSDDDKRDKGPRRGPRSGGAGGSSMMGASANAVGRAY